MNRHVRLYRVLLALYPPSFQREYAPDLVQAFTDLARDRGLASTWARCSVDLAVTIPRLHMEALVHRYSLLQLSPRSSSLSSASQASPAWR